MTETRKYTPRDGVDRVVRSGLVLHTDATIEASAGVLDVHGDVLEPPSETDGQIEHS